MSKRLAFLIDTRLCNNCKTCEIACKMERRLPEGQRWRYVRRIEKTDPATTDAMGGIKHVAFNVSMSCNHCEEPECVKICPVYAYKKMPDGPVVQTPGVCIGCTRCIAACPYSAPVYNPDIFMTFKCDMCYERLKKGLLPSCVQTCPNGALKVDTYETLVARYGAGQDLGSDTNIIPDGALTNPSIVIVKSK